MKSGRKLGILKIILPMFFSKCTQYIYYYSMVFSSCLVVFFSWTVMFSAFCSSQSSRTLESFEAAMTTGRQSLKGHQAVVPCDHAFPLNSIYIVLLLQIQHRHREYSRKPFFFCMYVGSLQLGCLNFFLMKKQELIKADSYCIAEFYM